jgi:hypothetical protein
MNVFRFLFAKMKLQMKLGERLGFVVFVCCSCLEQSELLQSLALFESIAWYCLGL